MRESRKTEKMHLPRDSYDVWVEKRVYESRARVPGGKKTAPKGSAEPQTAG